MGKSVSGNLNILLAEDNRGHAALVQKNLWRSCIEAQILHFSDGLELLAYLTGKSQIPEKFEPGKYLLLLDIKMPGMDGIEVLKTIENIPGLNQIPVIMLTTTDNQNEIDHCYAQNCAFYITKPSDYNNFMEAIEYLGAFLSLPSLFLPTIHPPETSIY